MALLKDEGAVPGRFDDLPRLLKESGGLLTSSQIEIFYKAKEAPIRERMEFESKTTRMVWEPYRMEKFDKERAIILYQENIELLKEMIANKPADYSTFLLSQLDFTMDRLTIVATKCGRNDEALKQIASFRKIGRDDLPPSEAWTRILKRESRLLSRKVKNPQS